MEKDTRSALQELVVLETTPLPPQPDEYDEYKALKGG